MSRTRKLGSKPRAPVLLRMIRRLQKIKLHPNVAITWHPPIWVGAPRPRRPL